MALTKEAAVAILFNQGVEQKDISKMLKISEVTISRWVTKSGLKRKRLNHSIRRQTSEENALTALDHQSMVIRRISEKLAEAMNDNMSLDELNKCLISKGEIDALQKLFTTIKGKELDWSYMVRILREFMGFLKDKDIRLAQEVTDHVDDYLNEKRRVM